jgi:hypothetical protein
VLARIENPLMFAARATVFISEHIGTCYATCAARENSMADTDTFW